MKFQESLNQKWSFDMFCARISKLMWWQFWLHFLLQDCCSSVSCFSKCELESVCCKLEIDCPTIWASRLPETNSTALSWYQAVASYPKTIFEHFQAGEFVVSTWGCQFPRRVPVTPGFIPFSDSSHITIVAVTAVLTAVWSLDHLSVYDVIMQVGHLHALGMCG